MHRLNISKALTGKTKSEEHINKINKNPEKIRKTAEKHMGMKRSALTRAKISVSRTNQSSYNRGLMDYYHPETGHVITSKEPPLGYLKGNPKLKGKAGGAGKKWWYDPISLENKCFLPGFEPLHWVPGKLSAKKKRGPRK